MNQDLVGLDDLYGNITQAENESDNIEQKWIGWFYLPLLTFGIFFNFCLLSVSDFFKQNY